jgi:hypothetical protein
MPGYLRFPTTTAEDTSHETENLSKTTAISHYSLDMEVQESEIFY